MKFLICVFLFTLSCQTIKAKEVCFDALGCFQDTKPFGSTIFRPIGKLPESPEQIDTTFVLFNKNYLSGQTVTGDTVPNGYLPRAATKVIIHGLRGSATTEWVVEMKDALLASTKDINVIVVDWNKGAQLPYEQACANSRVAGAVIAQFLEDLMKNKGVRSRDIHLIGFSLGAHTAGYVGERIQNLGRISGLDPAGPYFENTAAEVRLDSTDADFVDVIHTNAMQLSFGVILKEIGFGIQGRSGHVDYYPNGGRTQPGCVATNQQIWDSLSTLLQSWDFDDVTSAISCSHSSAPRYFIDSIANDCQFTAYPCKSFNAFSEGQCTKCSGNGCNRMGYFSSSSKEQGSLFLLTKSGVESNTCDSSVHFTLISEKKRYNKKANGLFEVQLISSTGAQSSTEALDDNETTFESESVVNKSVEFKELPVSGKITGAYVTYRRNYSSGFESRWSFKTIEIKQGTTSVTLCPVSKSGLEGLSKTTEYKAC